MPVPDISMLGDKELSRKLSKLVDRTQKKIVRQALRAEAKEVKGRVVANISRIGLIDTGVMYNAFQDVKIKSTSKRNFIRIGPENPDRNALGIHADDKYYYPYAVEFGHPGAEAKPFIRPAIDEHKDKSIRDIGKGIGMRIEREGRK